MEKAVRDVLKAGKVRTADLGGRATSAEVVAALVDLV
jgi:isocitrate/isopropylmalate dehydrogenase